MFLVQADSEESRTQLLLLQHEEHGIDQFKIFEGVVDDVEGNETLFIPLHKYRSPNDVDPCSA